MGVFDRIFGSPHGGVAAQERGAVGPVAGQAADYIDMDDERLLDDFLRYRGTPRSQAALDNQGPDID